MNERIRELAEQAGVYFGEAHKDYFGEEHPAYISTRDIDVQKFAELIVQECQEVVRWAISVDSTIERVPVLIREHFRVDFGVES